jgi:predicted DNA-binding transcriptional regulator AlpA
MNSLETNKPLPKLIRTRKTVELSGLPVTSLKRRVEEGVFVPSISLGGRSVAYVESEVKEIILAMIAGKNPKELKILVKHLVAQRRQIVAT